MHPIFQWLDYSYKDYGGFAKVTDDRFIGGFRNRLVAGVNVLNGSIDNQQFANIGGQKGALLSSSIDRSKNTSLYIEDSFYFLPNVAAIAGTQFLYATRNRQDRFLSNGDTFGGDRVQPVVAEGRSALEYRSDLAGLRQHLAQRRGAEFRRKRECTGGQRSFPSPASSRRPPPPMRSERG